MKSLVMKIMENGQLLHLSNIFAEIYQYFPSFKRSIQHQNVKYVALCNECDINETKNMYIHEE